MDESESVIYTGKTIQSAHLTKNSSNSTISEVIGSGVKSTRSQEAWVFILPVCNAGKKIIETKK